MNVELEVSLYPLAEEYLEHPVHDSQGRLVELRHEGTLIGHFKKHLEGET